MANDRSGIMNLSKSRVMAGLQCPKRVYLQVHEPELAAAPGEGSLARMEQGQEVGRLAQAMYPAGLLIEAGHEQLGEALVRTAQAVARDQAPAFFQATFEHDNVLIRTDILERQSKGHWRLIEVKSSTQPKEHHIYDVAIQRLVLEGCGFKVAPCLMHLNREYVYDGNQYELEKLFQIHDLTEEIAALKTDLRELIREQRRMLAQDEPPDIGPGRHCEDPVRCEFYDVCNQPLPEDHILNLPGLSEKKLAKLKDLAVERIGDIPKSFEFTERQRHASECVKSGKTWFGKGLKGVLAGLEYPLCFMDFETLALALPRFAGMRPYDQLPFQWSVHVRREPGGELEHHEFLADDHADPRPAFAESLCQAVGENGSVVVYNKTFESGCLENLARWLPKYQLTIAEIQTRLWDLLAVVRANVYHPRFMGSFSLKNVLPALVPEMSYEGMEVSEGTEAGLAWEKMICGPVDSDERNRLRAALLAYCKQDTLAMVRLLDTPDAIAIVRVTQ